MVFEMANHVLPMDWGLFGILNLEFIKAVKK